MSEIHLSGLAPPPFGQRPPRKGCELILGVLERRVPFRFGIDFGHHETRDLVLLLRGQAGHTAYCFLK